MPAQSLSPPVAHTPREIGGVPIHPILGVLPSLRRDELGALEKIASAGDVVFFRALHRRLHLVTSPEGARHVLVDGAKHYGKNTLGYARMRLVIGNGLLTSQGDFWKRQRRIAQPAFHKKRIATFADTMAGAAEDLARTLPDDEVMDVARAMMKVTLRIVGLTLLSHDVEGDADRVGDALTVALEHIMYRMNTPWSLPEWVPTRRNLEFRRGLGVLDGIVGGIIAERRAAPGGGHGDLLEMLMEATDEETGEGMSDAQLRDEAMTIFLAGHETTAMALSWTLHQLSHEPEWSGKLRAELARELGGRTPTLADLPALDLTARIVDESMRLHPPAWIVARSCEEDDVILGHPVKKGEWVLVSPYLVHRRADLWPDPERFDPDRFLPEAAGARPKYAYFPFAGGQRKCIGDAFAKMEATLVLAALFQRARFDAVPGVVVEHEPLVTLRPKGGLPMRVRKGAGLG